MRKIVATGLLVLGAVAPSFALDADAPINVTSNELEYTQNKQQAIFSGGVKVKHGKLALGSDVLKIMYANTNKNDKNAPSGLEKIHASGHVTVVDGENTASSNEAVYNPVTGILTMQGAVKMLRNGSVLTGDKLYYNPETGTMNLANENNGRVRATISLEKEDKQ